MHRTFERCRSNNEVGTIEVRGVPFSYFNVNQMYIYTYTCITEFTNDLVSYSPLINY